MSKAMFLGTIPTKDKSVPSMYYHVPELSVMMSYFITDKLGVHVSHKLLDLYIACNVSKISHHKYAASWDLDIVVWKDKESAKQLRHDTKLLTALHNSEFYLYQSTRANNMDCHINRVKGHDVGIVSLSLDSFSTIHPTPDAKFIISDYEDFTLYIRTYGLHEDEKYTRILSPEEIQHIKNKITGLTGYDPEIINKELNDNLKHKEDKIQHP